MTPPSGWREWLAAFLGTLCIALCLLPVAVGIYFIFNPYPPVYTCRLAEVEKGEDTYIELRLRNAETGLDGSALWLASGMTGSPGFEGSRTWAQGKCRALCPGAKCESTRELPGKPLFEEER